MEYMIVHRDDVIYRFRFRLHANDRLLLEPRIELVFQPIQGWDAERVKAWLVERNFEYYWEGYND